MIVDRKNLDAVDVSTLIYNSIVAIVILIGYQRVPTWRTSILINLGAVALILFAFSRVGERSPGLLRFAKSFYPAVLFTALYRQTGEVNRVAFQERFDPLLRQIEQSIFGFQPAIRFSQAVPALWFAEYMHFVYFSYYLLIPSMGLLLYFFNSKKEFKNYMFAVCNTFYVCYLIFIFFPAWGPLSFNTPSFPQDTIFISLVSTIIRRYDIVGGAFPSSHVAIATVVLYYASRHSRKALAAYAPLCISLMLATVYCGLHYAIDVFAGIVIAAVMIMVSWRIAPWRLQTSLQIPSAQGVKQGGPWPS